MNKPRIALIVIAASLYLAVPTLTRSNPILLFTEVSSTELTVTLDGNPVGTVINVGPDHWQWGCGTEGLWGMYNGNGIKASWQEPGGIAFNTLQFTDFGAPLYMGFDILSDSATELFGVAENGAYGFTFNISDSSGGNLFGPADVYFTDLGDSAVPEPGIVALTGLGLLALAAYQRSVAVNLAPARRCRVR